jgi:hypothetical protein
MIATLATNKNSFLNLKMTVEREREREREEPPRELGDLMRFQNFSFFLENPVLQIIAGKKHQVPALLNRLLGPVSPLPSSGRREQAGAGTRWTRRASERASWLCCCSPAPSRVASYALQTQARARQKRLQSGLQHLEEHKNPSPTPMDGWHGLFPFVDCCRANPIAVSGGDKMGCPRLRGWTPLVESSNLILWNFFLLGGGGVGIFVFFQKRIFFFWGLDEVLKRWGWFTNSNPTSCFGFGLNLC